MICPRCGDICRCSEDTGPALSPHWVADAASRVPDLTPPEQPDAEKAPGLSTPPEISNSETSAKAPAQDSPAWRNEIAARLNRYQARRKPRPPRYPSLRLRFEEQEDATRAARDTPVESSPFSSSLGVASNHALALDSFAQSSASEDPQEEPGFHSRPAELSADEPSLLIFTQPPIVPAGKIIEFPRSWTPPPAPLDELAEPVTDRPRILEAPEVLPPAPALGGITIEPTQRPEVEKRPGIDIPLQSAPLARRIFSAVIDDIIIAAACTFFGFIFWRMTAIELARLRTLSMAAGLFSVLWAAYQYLLVVYSGSTPGLRLMKLRLARFDGNPAKRRLRRWRVLASFLSAVSLGMGYAWVFLDEDALCWHDRITHTYLAPNKRNQEQSRPPNSPE